MNKIIRQAFGSTRPGDIFSSLLTFDRLTTRPIIHIVYWLGLGLLFIGACIVAGIAVGTAIKEGVPMGILLALPVLVTGWLMVLIGILLWRAFCEFYMAVLNIADDLRYLRQFQERLNGVVAPTPQSVQPAAPAPTVQPAATRVDPLRFEVPTSEAPATVQPETGDILEDPFFRPRFGKADN